MVLEIKYDDRLSRPVVRIAIWLHRLIGAYCAARLALWAGRKLTRWRIGHGAWHLGVDHKWGTTSALVPGAWPS